VSIAKSTESCRKEIARATEKVYLRSDATVEIRGFGKERGWKKTYTGWFDNREAFVAAAMALKEAEYEVYATLNACSPNMLARADNTLVDARDTGSTSDEQIVRRLWIPVDFDPQRESGISATDEEKAAAHALALEARGYLAERGITSLFADSGNGYHLLIPVDLPNTPVTLALVDAFLKALDARFSNDEVHVDTGVQNAARIMKIYGTTARKGNSVERLGRVHRPSAVLDVPEDMSPVAKEVLQKIAGEAPDTQAAPARGKKVDGDAGEWLDKWLEAHPEVPIKGGWKPWKGTGRMIALEHCPWNEHRDNAPFLGQLPDGRITARCHHNSCTYDWHEFREFYDPKAERVRTNHAGRAFELTDTGNGERFAAEHGGDVRWVSKWKKHVVWNGRKWEVDAREDVTKKAQRTAKGIHVDASAEDLDTSDQKAISKHAIASQRAERIRAMIDMAKGHMIADHEDFDSDLWLLNCQNGTVDLRTGRLREHDREALITKATPVEYDPSVATPVFDAFLRKIVPDAAIRAFLQRAFGMALSGEVRDNVLIILHGTGSNGKSTLMDTMMEAFGDYAISSAPDLLMSKANSHPTELADLFGARLVSCMESEEGRRLNEGLVKQLTGRDRIKARRMREDFWEFDPTHSVFFGTNHKPEVRGTDHAIWRRLKLVPFEVTIPDAEQDKDLPAKLREELPGILAWAVQGCLEWQRSGLREPQKVTEATQGYRAAMDVIAQFVEDECVETESAEVGSTALHIAYKDWCRNNNEEALSQRKFGNRIKERGHTTKQYTSGPNVGRMKWVGIGLKSRDTDTDGPDGSSSLEEREDALASENARSGVNKGHDTSGSIETRATRANSVLNAPKNARGESYSENSSSSSSLASFSSDGAPLSSALEPGESAPVDQLARIRKLVNEGMKEELARAEVLGEGDPAESARPAWFDKVERDKQEREEWKASLTPNGNGAKRVTTREDFEEYMAELEQEPPAPPPKKWNEEDRVSEPETWTAPDGTEIHYRPGGPDPMKWEVDGVEWEYKPADEDN
jgi:P4 family phage/plasmid primase-like protien